MSEETYQQFTETKQELPHDPASLAEDTITEENEEEDKKRGRIRHYKKYDVMLKECEESINKGKRLPKLHSRWIVNRYINEHMFTLRSIPDHNRMVDELQALRMEVYRLRKRVDELEK